MNKQYKKLGITVIPILVISVIYLFFSVRYFTPKSSINIANHEKHRGICWVGGAREIDESEIIALVDKNINWISQTPFGWQSGYANPEITGNHSRTEQNGWWGERDEGLKTTTEYAKANGIKTILKPHIWLRDQEGKWRGEIKMKSEEDWQKWFSDYEEFILHYAQIAEETQMEMLCIGTELHQTCVERDADWRKLIAKIRAIYSGELTYAANFSGEYQDVKFWDALDYIGVQAYFPLTDMENPTVEELRKGWAKPLKDLEEFSIQFNKPVLFTEVGYKSTKDAGIDPWEWPQRINAEERENIFSEETQANAYQALFDEVMDAPWFAGVHIWKWYPNYGSGRNSSEFNIDFTPQQKQAEQIIINAFAKYK
ncbi:glycoside hydrolase family 113 [Roseivirga echinicomitans]